MNSVLLACSFTFCALGFVFVKLATAKNFKPKSKSPPTREEWEQGL